MPACYYAGVPPRRQTQKKTTGGDPKRFTYNPDFRPVPSELIPLMTHGEAAAYQDLLRKQQALTSPLDFAIYATAGSSEETQEYDHIRMLNSLVVALVEHRLYWDGPGEEGLPDPEEPDKNLLRRPTPEGLYDPDGDRVLMRLFVTMPPRHGKSYLISEHTAPWFLIRMPSGRVLLATYEADFAAKWGGISRDLIDKVSEDFGISTDPSTSAKSEWSLLGERGGMDTAGVGGPFSGKGAHLLIIDDPIKNDEDAQSEIKRKKNIAWWYTTAKTRLEPGGVVLLVHTRWHEDDLGGHLMANEGEKWFHIDLPALQPDDEDSLSDTELHSGAGNPLRRAPGAALCPSRYSRKYLEDERESDPHSFSALYQQRPTTEGSGIFKRANFRYWRPLKPEQSINERPGGPNSGSYVLQLTGKSTDGTVSDVYNPQSREKYVPVGRCFHFMTVDLAATKKTWSDYTVFALWAVTADRELLLVDLFRRKIDSADHYKELKAFYEHCQLHATVAYIGIESATYGITLLKIARRYGLPVRELTADTDKVTRAIPAGAFNDDHSLFLGLMLPGLVEFEEEHLKFPLGGKDDQVDNTAYAVGQVEKGLAAIWLQDKAKADQSTTMMPERMRDRVEKHWRRKVKNGEVTRKQVWG